MDGGPIGDMGRPSLPDELGAIANYEALRGIANELDALLLQRERAAARADERTRWRDERHRERARLQEVRPTEVEQVLELLGDWGARVRSLRDGDSDA